MAFRPVHTNLGNVTTATVSNLVWGVRYSFVGTAFDTEGLESDFSNQVEWEIAPPAPPRNLKIKVRVVNTTSLEKPDWKQIAAMELIYPARPDTAEFFMPSIELKGVK